MIDNIRKRLKAGSEASGITLTADECDLLLRNLKTPSAPNSRKPQANPIDIKLYCLQLQRGGMSPSDAVAKTATHFSCSKWSVNAALRLRTLKK
ncbi:hypothetical protein [Bradyrhizobium sp.]|uniref:hypothetical protein n=1 Tax=Bradyrhizobium sp. TaxID=376 RepID=UPI003BB0D657